MERQEGLRKMRFNTRRTVDELIRPILNLDIIETFSQEKRPQFDQIPLKFDNYT
jgi:hypothetical protein